jgi:thiosulfate/3-mercaptopyruvate sulfurtransferase
MTPEIRNTVTASPLISVGELVDTLQADPELVLLDVRWTLGQRDGRERFLDGHIPGARFVDLDTELAAPPSPARGRHPLPTREAFQDTLRSLGVTRASTIVAYDQAHSFSAARLWWLLRNAGFETARVLDGGLRAWIETGHPLVTGEPDAAAPSTVVIDWDRIPSIEINEVAAFPEHGILLDARAGERYRGETEPMDPRAGHIPGALSAPTTGNLDRAGAFLPADELRARFTALELDASTPVAVYCGSGITASHQILALEVVGLSGTLFPGSWSQWSNNPQRPAATGATP